MGHKRALTNQSRSKYVALVVGVEIVLRGVMISRLRGKMRLRVEVKSGTTGERWGVYRVADDGCQKRGQEAVQSRCNKNDDTGCGS